MWRAKTSAPAAALFRRHRSVVTLHGSSGGDRVTCACTGRVDLSFRPDVESQERPLFYIDGVRFGSSDLSLKLDAIESIETVSGDAAVALYGGEAFAGVVRISLKEERP